MFRHAIAPARVRVSRALRTSAATRQVAPSPDAPRHCPCAGDCPRCANGGTHLDGGIRRALEHSYGTPLDGVRVHTGPEAHEVARQRHAHAVTYGSDIFFAHDRYQPHTQEGWRRIAHEVAHVVQQRRGAAAAGAHGGAEREARQSAGRATAGAPAVINARSGGLVQCDDGGATPSPDTELQLDPELRQLMLQQYLRWWVGTALTEGEPTSEGETASTLPGIPSPWTYIPPMQPDFLRPIDPMLMEPDMGAIMAPYNLRNVPLAARDVDAAGAIFQRNYAFVSILPDLRSAAPSFIRPLIPTHWRRSLAEGFTAATLNAQLRSDYPTPLEAADLSFLRLTGVSTTYVTLPGFSF